MTKLSELPDGRLVMSCDRRACGRVQVVNPKKANGEDRDRWTCSGCGMIQGIAGKEARAV